MQPHQHSKSSSDINSPTSDYVAQIPCLYKSCRRLACMDVGHLRYQIKDQIRLDPKFCLNHPQSGKVTSMPRAHFNNFSPTQTEFSQIRVASAINSGLLLLTGCGLQELPRCRFEMMDKEMELHVPKSFHNIVSGPTKDTPKKLCR